MTPPVRWSLALVLPALALASCGGSSDSEKITAIIKDVGKTPAHLCTRYATSELLATVGGMSGCAKAAESPSAPDPNVKVLTVKVTGGTAIAQIQGNTGKNSVTFTKVAGNWKVSKAG